VDFELSEDQQALGQAAGDLLDGRSPMTIVRAAMDRGGEADEKLWAAMVEQGWSALIVPEEDGGLGLGWVEAAVVLEQVGAHVAPAPILGQLVALDVLGETDWGPRLVAGDAVAAVAPRLGEPVPYAPSADVVVVPEDGHLVALDLTGHRPPSEPAMDLTRPLGWLRPDAVVTAPRLVLGGGGEIAHFTDVASVAYSAELLGVAQRALDLAVAYAREREQFGRPIGSFQAVKHRCADMLVDVEGMRSATYWAAWCVSAGEADASVAASTAKCWCSDAATRVLASALQVHGGIGFTWENDLHLYLKRAQLDALSFGDARFHRVRLGKMLRARVERGDSVI
jgi:alkylation response protein AidB-like acyl-CoA dehydrogenase